MRLEIVWLPSRRSPKEGGSFLHWPLRLSKLRGAKGKGGEG